jgi:hypothetical protein
MSHTLTIRQPVLDSYVVRLSTGCSFSERIVPMRRNETVTRRMTGNGLVIERTERVGGAIPWWWIADASRVPKTLSQTYHHRETLKAYGCRWSHKRRSWYYIGTDLPDEIAALLGPQDTTGEPVAHDHPPEPAMPVSLRCSPQLTATVATVRESHQARVLRQFVEQFQADLERVTRYPALPAVATIRLDDPWA